jgi:hypothetical protein
MNNKIPTSNVINTGLMMLIVVMAIVLAITFVQNENLEAQAVRLETVREPKVITGEYTIIHYPSGGWANAIYITEYKLDGQVLWYKEKDSTEDKPIWFSSVLLADGWLYGEALADYGYWISEYEF